MVAVRERLDFADLREVHDRRAMDAHESARIQLRLHVADAIATLVRPRRCVHHDVVVLRLDEVDVLDAHEMHAVPLTDRDVPIEGRDGRRCRFRPEFAVMPRRVDGRMAVAT